MPLVSIITPTVGRRHFLPVLWDCVRNQSLNDVEWLIHDGSQQSANFDWLQDPRVQYIHDPAPMRIGAKRNALCAAATGEMIAHFDDDDHYGPRYIEGMHSFMTDMNVDFAKLFGFYLYHRNQKILAYWDLERDFPYHFRLHPAEALRMERHLSGASDRWGYGFSYVFRRRVWEAIHFPDQGHGEDQIFAEQAVNRFRSAGKQDFAGSCLHVLHASANTWNISFAFPQQILLLDLLPQLFPEFKP